MRRAFVSHSTSDDRYVAEMESFLRAAGFDEVFNDVSALRPDEKFWPAIDPPILSAVSFAKTSRNRASRVAKPFPQPAVLPKSGCSV